MKSRRYLALFFAAMLLCTAPLPALAEGGGFSRAANSIFALIGKLDLSDQQKHDAATLIKERRTAIRSKTDSVLQARLNLNDAINSLPYDEAKVRDAAKSLAVSIEELAVERAKLHSELQQMLSDEQREILAEVKDNARNQIESKVSLVRTIFDRWVDRNANG